MTTVLWWVRRDLRLEDNQAPAAAVRSAAPIVDHQAARRRALDAYQAIQENDS